MAIVGALAQLADLAEAQDGLVSTRQAANRGVSRATLARLATAGALERVAHGVYLVSGAPRARLLELRAAWIQLAPGVPVDQRAIAEGVISYTSATQVLGVGLLESFQYHFTLPTGRRLRTQRSDVALHGGELLDTEVVWRDGLLVTSGARTVADLAAARSDGGHLAGVISDLIYHNITGREALTQALTPHAVAYGFGADDGSGLLEHLIEIGGNTAI